MSRHAFYVYGDRVCHIANPCAAGVNYHARERVLTPGELTSPGQHPSSETVIVVTEGQLELMVNGASAAIGAGQFVRIQPGHWFAMRNSDYRLARVLVRVAPLPASPPSRRIMVEIAAA
jgi:mannose-6-phosphate isomerase-like protein (cupin superfamily)